MSVKIYYRKDRQKWQVVYYVDGKRKRPQFDEKPEAVEWARKIELGLNPEDVKSITIPEAAHAYFDRVSQKKNAKSRVNDKRYLNLFYHYMWHLRGIKRVGTVQLEDMEGFRDWLTTKPLYDDKPVVMGPSTVNRCIRVLKHFFRKLIQWKHIADTPCTYLDLLDSIENSRPAMTADQFVQVIDKCDGWLRKCVMFTFLTGAPPTCIERLDWSEVNLPGRFYSVLRKKGTKAKWRRIPMSMSEPTFALLVEIQNETGVNEGPVFRDECGRRLLADRVSRAANDAIREAGITGVTFYGLRHALASDMTAAGIATEVVRQAMGHQSIATTQKYANKIKLQVVTGALESVRGGKLVANGQ